MDTARLDTAVNTQVQQAGGAIIPAQPPAATSTALSVYQKTPALFIAHEHLQPPEVAAAQQMAAHLDVSNTAALIAVGNAELALLGDVSDQMIKGQRKGDIPEVGQKMAEVVRAMKTLRQHNFQPDAQIREQMEKGVNF
ncbi:MAG TPA: hypothetical protein VKY74_26280, partial [Chloroflexia bacterium]|nr:hypothetical protein [Chloroflexia bacterium]